MTAFNSRIFNNGSNLDRQQPSVIKEEVEGEQEIEDEGNF